MIKRNGPAMPFVVAVLSVAVCAFAAVAGEVEERPSHPEVEGQGDCVGCHADITPAQYRAWYEGPHGRNNVKCFVCHGSTGDDFVIIPMTSRCIGCHATNVASMQRPMYRSKTCFSCHPAHALDPHAEAVEGNEEGGRS